MQSNDQDQDQDQEPDPQSLKFFNYHEISIRGISNYTIIQTHFPNIYNTSLQETTRIVRIPLTHQHEYPELSSYLPGHEPAAVLNPIDQTDFTFVPIVQYKGEFYGYSSVSPLSLYLTQSEFEVIINRLNELLKLGWSSHKHTMWNIIDLLTFGVLRWLRFNKLEFDKIESYITEVNNKFKIENKPIQIISLRRSGYLSLDFQVPRPIN